jgi:hypothetical protein
MESKRLIGSLSRESCISMPSSIFWESLFARKLPQNLTTVWTAKKMWAWDYTVAWILSLTE